MSEVMHIRCHNAMADGNVICLAGTGLISLVDVVIMKGAKGEVR